VFVNEPFPQKVRKGKSNKGTYPPELRKKLLSGVLSYEPPDEELARKTRKSMRRKGLTPQLRNHQLYISSIGLAVVAYTETNVLVMIQARITSILEEYSIEQLTPGRVTASSWPKGAQNRWINRYSQKDWDFTTMALLYRDEKGYEEELWLARREAQEKLEMELHRWVGRQYPEKYKIADKEGDKAAFGKDKHFYLYLAVKISPAQEKPPQVENQVSDV